MNLGRVFHAFGPKLNHHIWLQHFSVLNLESLNRISNVEFSDAFFILRATGKVFAKGGLNWTNSSI